MAALAGTQHVVHVMLIVKSDAGPERAESEVLQRLNRWVVEPPLQGPYPNGTLLYWQLEGGGS